MADVQHSAIADPDIHEPKGVAAAASGEVYVANGAGSGAWGLPLPQGIDAAAAGQILVANGAGGGSWQNNSQTTKDYGEIYIQGNTVATTIAAVGTFVQVTDGVTAGQLNGPSLSSGALSVAEAANYIIEASVTFTSPAATAVTWDVDFLLNGVAFGRKQSVSTSATESVTVSLRAITGSLAVNDTIALGIANTTDTNNPTVVHASLTIRQL